MDPYSSVCFDIPGGRKNRRREAADLGPDALMLCSDAAPADKDADAVADTADSYGDDPLPPPVQPPPPTPGEVPSGFQAAVVALAWELPPLPPSPPPLPPTPPPQPPGGRASREELSERESDAIADSPIDHHSNE